MRRVLNEFIRIYYSYERICGKVPKINWRMSALLTANKLGLGIQQKCSTVVSA